MGGRIKSGEGSLIGNSGEHYVMAELLKQGVTAALTPRNTPAFDILATDGKTTAKIRVKTKSEEFEPWQWVIKKDGTIFRGLSREQDFVVLVNLKTKFERPDFYIIPTFQVDSWLKERFEEWLRSPGKHGRAHNPENKKRHLNYKFYAQTLEVYRDKWAIIWKEGSDKD